jgi:Tfp pilus assembly protein PilF
MTRALLEQAFGSHIDLYNNVLQCPKDASNAQLRKAYYKRAREFHPDKNTVSYYLFISQVLYHYLFHLFFSHC